MGRGQQRGLKNGEARGSEERAGARFRKRSDVKKTKRLRDTNFAEEGRKKKNERKKQRHKKTLNHYGASSPPPPAPRRAGPAGPAGFFPRGPGAGKEEEEEGSERQVFFSDHRSNVERLPLELQALSLAGSLSHFSLLFSRSFWWITRDAS